MRLLSLLLISHFFTSLLRLPLLLPKSRHPNPTRSLAIGRGTKAAPPPKLPAREAAAKIIPQVMGPSPMEENLRRLTDEIGGRVTGSPEMAKAVDWAVAAFRAKGSPFTRKNISSPIRGAKATRAGNSRPGEVSGASGLRGVVAGDASGRSRSESDLCRRTARRMISRRPARV